MPADTEMPRPEDRVADVVLFGLERSVYTRIARLALAEKGVPHSLREVEIFGPAGVPAEHLARHPFGRIPVLRHGGFMLYETASITRYVDEAFDLHAFPMLRCFALTGDGRTLLARFTRLHEWLKRMDARPSVAATRSVYERSEA